MIPLNQNLLSLQRSGIRVYTNLARQTPGCAMLTIGEPDFDTPSEIRQAAQAALDANETHYAPNQGIVPLREKIAAFETKRGMPTTADQVLVTVGATGGLFTALMGILNPGEEVIIPTPAFSLYETITLASGGKPVAMDISKTGFQIDREVLKAAISPRTKALILNSPCNPTGCVLNQNSLETVIEAVRGKNIFVICDNVYNQLIYTDCPDISLNSCIREQMIYCQSFSKPYAMTGWRIGYLVCPEYVMDRLLLLSAAQMAAVPTFIQKAAITALDTDNTSMLAQYRRRREYVCSRLDAMGLRYPKPEGSFYVFVDISRFGMDADTFCQRLIREGKLAAVPGTCFGAEGFLRLSYCYSDDELKTGLDRLEAFIHNL